jgi:uncharacterized protein (DUF58 family)
VAAALAYLVLEQQDSVGLATFDTEIRSLVRPSSNPSHLKQLLHVMETVEAVKKTRTGPIFHDLAERLKRRGLVLILSDLFDDVQTMLAGLKHFRHRRHDVVVFHVLDPAELEFPFTDPSAFEDLESGEQLPVVPESFREKYRALVQAHVAELTAKAAERGVDYRLLDTSKPLDFALYDYLSFRERSIRIR